ncbi:MAG: transglycosylase SLT domain-containing protein [Bacteroidales bacterium]|nr:transglycosylase SLT domain-containing protein [Bacteroidales bacterium]
MSLQNIRERNELTVLIRANSSDYFIHRGVPKGFQLELTQLFADYLGVNLRIISTEESEMPFHLLEKETIDIIASNITILGTDRKFVYFKPFKVERSVSWGILCNADSLANVMMLWMDSISQTRTFTNLCLKYHKERQSTCRLSPYDDAIKKHAERLNWDWRLLASLIYQESNFYPHVESWAGAIGLMQLMPDVAEKYGITLESSADAQILAGVKHLQEIDKLLPDEIPKSERIAFMLASYNVGVGHILDARRLAVKYGKNPNVWFEHVEVELLKKSDRTIVRDSIIRHGYARGEETYNFVRDIFERWGHYQNLIPHNSPKTTTTLARVSFKCMLNLPENDQFKLSTRFCACCFHIVSDNLRHNFSAFLPD